MAGTGSPKLYAGGPANAMSTECRARGADDHEEAVATRLLALATGQGFLVRADVVDEFAGASISPEALEGVRRILI